MNALEDIDYAQRYNLINATEIKSWKAKVDSGVAVCSIGKPF